MDELERRKREVLRKERQAVVYSLYVHNLKKKKYKRVVAAIDRQRDVIQAELAEGKRWSERRMRTALVSARDTEL